MDSINSEDGAPPASRRLAWPERIRASASELGSASEKIQRFLQDESKFLRLTDAHDGDEVAAEDVRAFHRLVVEALAAVIDLSAYDNPEQEYPDLTQWFEFRCANVVFGARTDEVSSGPPAHRDA